MKATLTAILCAAAAPLWAAEFPVQACVNMGSALEAPRGEGQWGYTITDADLALIAKGGFDTIRLPVQFSAHWDGSRIDPVFLARVDHVIRTALDLGLQVILDLHHFSDLMSDPDTHGPTFAAIWAELGAHYAGWPDGLIFELLNEPSGEMTTERVAQMFRPIIADLRQLHPERWIVVTGGYHSHIKAVHDVPDFDERTVVTFHYYFPAAFTHQRAPWFTTSTEIVDWGTPEEHAAISDDIARAAQRPGHLFLGEFGTHAVIDLDDRLAWTSALRRTAEENGMSWCIWSFAAGFSLVTPDNSDWLPGMLGALGLDDAG